MKVKKLKENKVGNDYVVGDIHGCFSLLQQYLDKGNFNPEVDRLICVGDLVDRGPESEKCLEWLSKPWFHCVLGNHEQMAIDYYSDIEVCSELYSQNGGDWFMDLHIMKATEIACAFGHIPIAMEIETRYGNVGIVHADTFHNDWLEMVEELEANSPKLENKCIWSRDRIVYCKDCTVISNIWKVYHGHTPRNMKTVLGNRHYIDIGTVFTNKFHIENITTGETYKLNYKKDYYG